MYVSISYYMLDVTCTNSFRVCAIIILLLQIKKLRHREVK